MPWLMTNQNNFSEGLLGGVNEISIHFNKQSSDAYVPRPGLTHQDAWDLHTEKHGERVSGSRLYNYPDMSFSYS